MGQTELEIEMRTHQAFEQMFNQAWPKALQLLKNLVEVGSRIEST